MENWTFVWFGWTLVTAEYLGRHLGRTRRCRTYRRGCVTNKISIKSNLNFSARLVAPPLRWTPQNWKRESSAHSVLDVQSSQVLLGLFLTFKVARSKIVFVLNNRNWFTLPFFLIVSMDSFTEIVFNTENSDKFFGLKLYCSLNESCGRLDLSIPLLCLTLEVQTENHITLTRVFLCYYQIIKFCCFLMFNFLKKLFYCLIS